MVLVVLSMVVFAGGLRGPAVAVTVLDDAVVGWLAGLDAPCLAGIWRALAFLGSWWVLNILGWGLVLALLALRRFRQLIIVLVVTQLLTMVLYQLVGPIAQRPRPFRVEIRAPWSSWALPSVQVAALAATLVVILYTLVPEGRWRQRGKWVAAGVVALAGLGWVALGAEAPTDVLVGAAIGVTIPLVLFRWFAPNEVFPITYRRGRAAHLDVTGPRGEAIRRGLEDQLGPRWPRSRRSGWPGRLARPRCGSRSRATRPATCSASCMPAATCAPTAGTSSASSSSTGAWRTRSRSTPCGGWSNRRTMPCACAAMRPAHPRPYGVVELTPEREYLLVSEFFDGAVELGEAEVDQGVIDDGMRIIRKLWEAGLAHRDIKPANLLVRDGRLLLIDVAFIESGPAPGGRRWTWPT